MSLFTVAYMLGSLGWAAQPSRGARRQHLVLLWAAQMQLDEETQEVLTRMSRALQGQEEVLQSLRAELGQAAMALASAKLAGRQEAEAALAERLAKLGDRVDGATQLVERRAAGRDRAADEIRCSMDA